MNSDWTDTLDRLDAVVAHRLARATVPPPAAAAPPPDLRTLFARWETALDRLADDATVEDVVLQLTAFRERLSRASGTARAA